MSKGLLCACVIVAAACGKGPTFTDDEGGHNGGAEGSDLLSQPYAKGTHVRITVDKASPDWKLRSDDSTIFSVDKVAVENRVLTADCSAPSEGSTRIVVVDGSGSEQRATSVTVKVPDRAVILAHGQARLLGKSPASTALAEVTSAQVLTGGKAVFMVGYFHGNERLYGRGLANPTSQAQLVVNNVTSSGGPISEWLFVTATVDGDYNIQLNPGNGPTVATLAVTAVPASAIASVKLSEELGFDQKEGTKVWVLAQTVDSTGRAIYGGYSTWTLDGKPQLNGGSTPVSGDFFRYNFAAGAQKDLVATEGGLTATFKVSASDGTVGDTTYLGCDVSRGRGRPRSPWGWALLLLAAPLLLLRRRVVQAS